MSEKNNDCECGKPCKCRCRKKTTIVALLAVLALAVAALMVKCANDARAEKERIAAEWARIEAIMKKPLLEWTDADKAELPEVYENRRQRERVSNPKLWTKEEKKAEWLAYSRLVADEALGKVAVSMKEGAGAAKEGISSFVGRTAECAVQWWNKTMECVAECWERTMGLFSRKA